MRGIILKESEILDKALKGEIDKKTMFTLRVLTKFYFIEGNSKEQVENKLNEYMKKYYSGYKPSKWKDILNQLVKSVSKLDTYELQDVDNISITENEWNSILRLEKKQLQKLAFVLLIYCKINNEKSNESKNRVNQNFTDIFYEAHIKMIEENKLLLTELKRLGYIDTSLVCDSTTITVKYCDYNSGIKFIIDNFINVISYYDEYTNNKKYISCEICKKRVVQKANNFKYCNKCANKIKQQQINELKRKNRNGIKMN